MNPFVRQTRFTCILKIHLGFDETQIADAVNDADLEFCKAFLTLTGGPDPFYAEYIDPYNKYLYSSWSNSALHDL